MTKEEKKNLDVIDYSGLTTKLKKQHESSTSKGD